MIIIDTLISFVTIFFIIYILVIKNKKYLLIDYSFVLSYIMMILSSLYIDTGVYVLELGITTYTSIATILLCVILAFFVTMVNFTLKIRTQKEYDNSKLISFINSIMIKFLPSVAIISIIYLYIDLIKTGIPLLDKSIPNRMNFFAFASMLPLTKTLYSLNVYYFPLIMGFAFEKNKSKVKKIEEIIYIISVVVYLFLLGFKVSGPMDAIYSFILPILLINLNNGKIKFDWKKIIKIILCILVITFSFVFINYKIVYKTTNIDTMKKIFDRTFGMSSHMWWAAVNIKSKNNFTNSTENIKNEISSIFNSNGAYDERYGCAKLMVNLADSSIATGYLKNNTRMATSIFTVALYNTGYILDILYSVIIAIILGFIIKDLYNSIRYKNILLSILIYKIFIFFKMYVNTTGTLTDIINIKNIVVFALIILLKILNNYSYRNDVK